jgi:hypothetical protein
MKNAIRFGFVTLDLGGIGDAAARSHGLRGRHQPGSAMRSGQSAVQTADPAAVAAR